MRCATGRTPLRAALALLMCAATGNGAASDLNVRAELEARWFPHVAEPSTGASLAGTAEYERELADGAQFLRVEAFARVDSNDAERSHADLREASWQSLGDRVVLTAGVRRVFWGYAESRHLVDIVNQTDFVEDLESEHKLGQPLLGAAWVGESSTLDLMLLPVFRERSFPGRDGHPRVPVPIAEDEAVYAHGARRSDLSYAVRYGIAFNGTDVGLSWFEGVARDPRLLLCFEEGSSFNTSNRGPDCSRSEALLAGDDADRGPLTALMGNLGLAPDNAALRAQVVADLIVVPHYEPLQQLSLDAQHVSGPWSLKLEALSRERLDQRTHAAVVGLEYTIGNVLRSGAALGLVAEWLRDEQADVLSARFDDEWFAGLRLALLDRRNTQALLGLLGDRHGGDRLLQLEFSLKPAKNWRLSGKLRSFDKVPGDELSGFLRDEDLLSLSLERYF